MCFERVSSCRNVPLRKMEKIATESTETKMRTQRMCQKACTEGSFRKDPLCSLLLLGGLCGKKGLIIEMPRSRRRTYIRLRSGGKAIRRE